MVHGEPVEDHRGQRRVAQVRASITTTSRSRSIPRDPTRSGTYHVFVDDRNRSAPIKVVLEPGGKVSHRMNVGDWAARAVNGGRALEPGSHMASAVYAVTDTSVWTGRIESGELALSVPAR